jgi:hypothetical protein
MQRTINYTGRKKIHAKELKINLQTNEQGSLSFDVDLNLDKKKLPDEASIYIEAYQRNTLQRFNFGTVGQIRIPEDRTLNEIDLSSPTLFRVHVVDESEYLGRLIASADQLRPEGENDEDQKSGLLPVKSRPMGEETWKIEFETGGKPQLCINSRIPDAIGQMKNNSLFQTLILPAAFRQVLMYYIWDDNNDEGSIADEWLRFAEHIASEKPEDSDPAVLMKWVDEVVERFSNSFKLCGMLLHKMEES